MATKRPRLSRERILDAALQLIETNGAGGLTMRSLAKSLDAAPMSLYTHVATKEEILDAVVDRAIAAWTVDLDPSLSWQESLVELFGTLAVNLEKQPGVLELLLLRSVEGEAANHLREMALRTMLDGGLPPAQALQGLGSLYALTVGFAATARRQGREHPAFAGLSADDHPALRATAAEYDERTSYESLRVGLRHLVRGLEADASRQKG